MSTAAELQEKFAILDHVRFVTTESGLIEIQIATPHASATLYTQGAHMTHWQPTGQEPGLYLSPKSAIAPGKAIRGGIPVLFPWFGAFEGNALPGVTYPAHGIARVAEWTVERTHFSPDGDVEIELSLTDSDTSRHYGFDHFRCVMLFEIGTSLSVTLQVTNTGEAPLQFGEGLHTYFAVSDSRTASVAGLEGTEYLDKMDDFKRKKQTETLLHFTQATDQVHVNTATDLTIHDSGWKRDVLVAKEGSSATVCWNPWTTLTPSFKDLAEDSWEKFVCVEAVNTGENSVTLAPGATHTLSCTVSLTPKG